MADPAVEQRLRLSKILSKESVSTKWKQLHGCPEELARTTYGKAGGPCCGLRIWEDG